MPVPEGLPKLEETTWVNYDISQGQQKYDRWNGVYFECDGSYMEYGYMKNDKMYKRFRRVWKDTAIDLWGDGNDLR